MYVHAYIIRLHVFCTCILNIFYFIDKPILSFRRNAFFPLREEKRLIAKKNSKEVITLLYHEVIYTNIKIIYYKYY